MEFYPIKLCIPSLQEHKNLDTDQNHKNKLQNLWLAKIKFLENYSELHTVPDGHSPEIVGRLD